MKNENSLSESLPSKILRSGQCRPYGYEERHESCLMPHFYSQYKMRPIISLIHWESAGHSAYVWKRIFLKGLGKIR